MTNIAFEPVYRATVYAPRTTANPTESTPLTPASGAAHSDAFKVASATGISGFQPYLSTRPRGRKSRFNPVTRKLDIGTVVFNLLDRKINSGELQRWITAFIGDDTGKNRLRGLKVFIEESLDGGIVWRPFYVGRIADFSLEGLIQYKMEVRESNVLQKKVKLFAGKPSGSVLGEENGGYANERLVMPCGPDWAYGPFQKLGRPYGVWKAGKNSNNAVIEISITGNSDAGKIYATKPLVENVPEYAGEDAIKIETSYGFGPILEARSLITGAARRFYVTYIQVYNASIGQAISSIPYVKSMVVEPLPSSEYRSAALFSPGILTTLKIIDPREIDDESPLLLDDVHPIQLWKDCLKGAFGLLDPDGEAIYKNAFPIRESTFDALIADEATYKTARYQIKEEKELLKFIEDDILKPYNLGYRMEPTASAGVGYNEIVPFTLNLPTSSVGIPTISTEDLIGQPSWEAGEPFVTFETTYYEDRKADPALMKYDTSENPSLITEAPKFIRTLDVDNVYAGEGKFKTDATGIRFSGVELFVDINRFPFIFSRRSVMNELAYTFHQQNVYRWSRGPSNVKMQVRRSGSLEDIQIGDWRILNIDFLPGEFGHIRGEARLMQCVERSEEGINLNLRMVDSGRSIQTTAPVVGDFNQIAGSNSISGTVSITNTRRIEGGFSVTAQSIAARPDPTSSAWDIVYRSIQESGSTGVILGPCSSGARIWPRFRAWTVTPDELEIASDWVYPTNDYVDIPALNDPSNLSISQITKESAQAKWTNGEATASILVLVRPASSASFETAANLVAGSTRYRILGLEPSASNNPWTIGVRHRDQWGGTSNIVSASFTASGDFVDDWPAIGGLYILGSS